MTSCHQLGIISSTVFISAGGFWREEPSVLDCRAVPGRRCHVPGGAQGCQIPWARELRVPGAGGHRCCTAALPARNGVWLHMPLAGEHFQAGRSPGSTRGDDLDKSPVLCCGVRAQSDVFPGCCCLRLIGDGPIPWGVMRGGKHCCCDELFLRVIADGEGNVLSG